MRKRALILVLGRSGAGKSSITKAVAGKMGFRIVKPFGYGKVPEDEFTCVSREEFDSIPEETIVLKQDNICITYENLLHGDFLMVTPAQAVAVKEKCRKYLHIVEFYLYTEENLRKGRTDDPDFNYRNIDEDHMYCEYERKHGYDILLYNNRGMDYCVDNFESYAKIVLQYQRDIGDFDPFKTLGGINTTPEQVPVPDPEAPAEEPSGDDDSASVVTDDPVETDAAVETGDSAEENVSAGGDASVEADVPAGDDDTDTSDEDIADDLDDDLSDDGDDEGTGPAGFNFSLDDDDEDDESPDSADDTAAGETVSSGDTDSSDEAVPSGGTDSPDETVPSEDTSSSDEPASSEDTEPAGESESPDETPADQASTNEPDAADTPAAESDDDDWFNNDWDETPTLLF